MDGGNLLFEEYGSNLSSLLGCPSPKADYAQLGKTSLVLSRYVHPSRTLFVEEIKKPGQVMLVPRLLASYSHAIEKDGEILQDRLNCDVNRGQFLLDDSDIFYQVDFSPATDRTFTLSYVSGQLRLFGLTADSGNEVIAGQLALLKEYKFEDLYQAFTQRSREVMPQRVQKYAPMFAWNFDNIGRLLHALHTAPETRVRIVFH